MSHLPIAEGALVRRGEAGDFAPVSSPVGPVGGGRPIPDAEGGRR